MNDPFDDFVDELQGQIDQETRETFGEIVYQRWKNPLYMKALADPDGYARQTGSCGDSIEIWLQVDRGRIRDAGFQTDGCGPSAVCGSYAAEMAIGKTPLEAAELRGEDILGVLGGLPEENEHCAYLACAALYAAVEDYMSRSGKKP
ncbi:MAG TPA: iron-sulfur cluster assembly scaffold protein [Desulfosalsimonadaceae bacterium]|nr:iron-sulfur cluster assembly scaffold protein [Desulfosalsimonadaceae bacterium]